MLWGSLPKTALLRGPYPKGWEKEPCEGGRSKKVLRLVKVCPSDEKWPSFRTQRKHLRRRGDALSVHEINPLLGRFYLWRFEKGAKGGNLGNEEIFQA